MPAIGRPEIAPVASWAILAQKRPVLAALAAIACDNCGKLLTVLPEDAKPRNLRCPVCGDWRVWRPKVAKHHAKG